MRLSRFKHLALAALIVAASAGSAAAQFRLDPAFAGDKQLGPKAAQGAVVWSHGRSVSSEDSASPSPLYLQTLRDGGWDTFRFNRMRATDTLGDSSRELVKRVAALKEKGYRRVVLAGQSFGAFLSLMAADESDEVHAVIATAPAAYGSFSDFYESWPSNATQLYPLLERVRSARVMLFYFHGDDFDPGGRGERSETILRGRNIDHLVIDQPPQLVSHWAATTGLFVRRYGDCIKAFITAASAQDVTCDSNWGRTPSAQIPFPMEVSSAGAAGQPASVFAGRWYGFYGNGREVMFAIEKTDGDRVTAIYALGPGIGRDEKPEWSRRAGRIHGAELVFDEKGMNTLRYKLRPDGKLQAWWISEDGKSSLETTLRRTTEMPARARTQTATATDQE